MRDRLIRYTAQALARLSRLPAIRDGLRALQSAYRSAEAQGQTAASFETPEVLPITPSVDPRENPPPRLNLLVPAVSAQHVFGGIATALQVLDALRLFFPEVRIVVTDEGRPQPQDGTYYSDWPVVDIGVDSGPAPHIVAAGSRWGKTLPVHANDHFFATAWWTAHNGFSLLDWQRQQFAGVVRRRLLYLIQDYEPGFYPWSSRYLLACNTYGRPNDTLAVVNSLELAGYLTSQGHPFADAEVLTPRLNPALRAVRDSRPLFSKRPILLAYARPSTERNAFAVQLGALRLWAHSYPRASQWQVIGLGEAFDPIDLGAGCRLVSLGKRSLDEYANLLCDAAVGFSLMVSPHPSYPPLEMAAFGLHVVTNRFANKNLSAHVPHIVSPEPASPARFAEVLHDLTQAFDDSPQTSRTIDPATVVMRDGFLSPSASALGWAEAVAQRWLDGAPRP